MSYCLNSLFNLNTDEPRSATDWAALGASPAALGASPAALGASPAALGASPAALGASPAALGAAPDVGSVVLLVVYVDFARGGVRHDGGGGGGDGLGHMQAEHRGGRGGGVFLYEYLLRAFFCTAASAAACSSHSKCSWHYI